MAKEVESIGIQPFTRIKIMEDGTCKGDSGWLSGNQITQWGMEDFICTVLAASAGSSIVAQAQLGSGGAVASNNSRLPNSIAHNGDATDYVAVSKSTLTAANAGTVRWYGTFESSDGFMTIVTTIGNIGLYAATTSDSSMCAGKSFTASECSTNQDVQFTYEWRFTTA